MSASGRADDGDGLLTKGSEAREPPVRRHGTRLVRCVSETGEKRVVLHALDDGGWIDAARDDVSELSEMR